MRIPYFRHPSPRSLQRFAQGELSSATQTRMAQHLAGCVDCRASVTFTRGLRDALRRLPIEQPVPGLAERVIAERNAGARAILPTHEPALHRSRARRIAGWIALAGAAAAGVLVLAHAGDRLPRVRPRRVVASATDASVTKSTTQPGFVSSLFLPGVAFAQPARDQSSTIPALTLSGEGLRPLHLRYSRRTIAPDGRSRETGVETIDLMAGRVEDRDAWRLTQVWRIADTVQAETLFVDRTSLQMLGRTIHVGPYLHYRAITVRQRMLGDSLVGWMNTNEGLGRPIARRLAPDNAPYLSDALAPIMLSGRTLSPSWQSRFSLLGWAVRPNDVYLTVTLHVIAEEQVTVPAGTFECWRLSFDVSGATQGYWVRKSDGVAVRVRYEREGRTQEIVLIRG